MEYRCAVCSFRLWQPIARLGVSTLGLYDDARFPGRCLLVLNEHHDDFSTLNPELTARFVADVQLVGRAIRTALSPVRVNYALLGNAEPHVHFHLIPRYPDDPVPDQAPWKHPDRATNLPEPERRRVVAALQEALTRLQAAPT
ncbi:MAG: HIT family protein [Candidatus Eremiobacterota bacterium]